MCYLFFVGPNKMCLVPFGDLCIILYYSSSEITFDIFMFYILYNFIYGTLHFDISKNSKGCELTDYLIKFVGLTIF